MIETTTTSKRKKVMLTFENRLSIRYTCSKTTMENENLNKKREHLISNEVDVKTTDALKEQGTF